MKRTIRLVGLLVSAVVVACGTPGTIDGGVTVDAGTRSPDAGALTAVPLTACVPDVYTASVSLGDQPFELILDTASTTLAVAGKGCSSCSGVLLYQPGAPAIDQNATAAMTYGALAASGWSGEIYEDGVAVGAPAVSGRVRFVSIQQQSQFLVGGCGLHGATPQGVLGFAPALTATPGTSGVFDVLVADAGVPDVFAIELCTTGGTLWLGGYDRSHVSEPPVYTPLAPAGFDAYVYTVHVDSLTVAGTTVTVPVGVYTATLLDTGASISSLPSAEYAALTKAIAGSSGFQQVFGSSAAGFFASSNNCVTLSQTKAQLDALLPALTIALGADAGVTVQASATESYLLSPGNGRWCPAFTTREPSPTFQEIAAIFGAPILRSNIVIFDRANARVGFAPHASCP